MEDLVLIFNMKKLPEEKTDEKIHKEKEGKQKNLKQM